MTRSKIVSVVGTRPNFMKTAPVVAEIERRADLFEHVLVHTGQHYDRNMSDLFFEELGAGEPDRMLGVGSGTHAEQTGRVMETLEPLLEEIRPDVVIVPGDVNSTMAATLVAAKLHIPVAHIEAGLRSFDRTMPEEVNRIVTDSLADYLFIHSPEARENLLTEGRPAASIHYVGNTMIDTLVRLRAKIAAQEAWRGHGLDRGRFIVVTLHRPALVDGPLLGDAISALSDIAERLPVVFPVHPRTRARIAALGTGRVSPGLTLLEPLGYLEFMSLVMDAAGVLTDSGGIQEETTYLDVPCFTLRDNTERPVTVDLGTNTLLGLDPARIREMPDLIASHRPRPDKPPMWDGHAAERTVDVLAEALAGLAASRAATGCGTGR